ncbi:MAG: hypothetical protein AAFY15_08180, partial [Cyanobacteria bacterium J06648_11]
MAPLEQSVGYARALSAAPADPAAGELREAVARLRRALEASARLIRELPVEAREAIHLIHRMQVN